MGSLRTISFECVAFFAKLTIVRLYQALALGLDRTLSKGFLHALVLAQVFFAKPIVMLVGIRSHLVEQVVRGGAAEHTRQLVTLHGVKLVDVDPVVLLDEDNDEVLGDEADDVATAIHDREGRHALLQHLLSVLDGYDTFASRGVSRHDLERGHIPLRPRTIVPQ